jgi:hypothetical protein
MEFDGKDTGSIYLGIHKQILLFSLNEHVDQQTGKFYQLNWFRRRLFLPHISQDEKSYQLYAILY